MNILDRLLNRSSHGEAGEADPAEAGTPDEHQLPVPRYDHLTDKNVIAQLSRLSQLELAAIETHERSHQDRPVVLNRLHWLRASEPLPGYDALNGEEIVRALAGADTATLKAVREYERHHRDRLEVRTEVARVLPTSQASAGEERAREQQTALVREGFAGRAQTAVRVASDRPAPDGREAGGGPGLNA
jgi:hypothetical protein